MADYQDVEREHSFDGLSEYDNRVPGWLQVMFYLSVVWAAWYMGYYFFAGGELGVEAYETERIQILEERMANQVGLPDETTLRQLSRAPDRIAAGKELYLGVGTCTTCHGADALGMQGVGPNLRDDRWLYGSDMTDIVETLQYGRPGGMQAFSGTLTQDQIINLAAYIADINRSKKANGQGFMKDGETEQPIEY